jgi:hypothetical protein
LNNKLKRLQNILLLIFLILFPLNIFSQPDSVRFWKPFLFDEETLQINKQKIKSGDEILSPSFKKLYSYAKLGLTRGPYSVTYKDNTPPSGDKHDYMSLGPYWWPDPDKPDGLPYIRKDGVVNPEVYDFTDKQQLVEMCLNVKITSLAYFLTEEERFAEYAINLIKVWFVDNETKMNPNFNYGQSIPGLSDGRSVGIIEARKFIEIINAITLLQNSEHWNDFIDEKIKIWFENYFTWLLESDLGREESNAPNNHGTWYDVQTASIALFVGRENIARNIIEESKTKRINNHIDEDGKQPAELVRTNSLGYSAFNLEALFTLAQIGNYLEIDLWSYESPNGASLKKAFDFLVPFFLKEKEWEYEQIKEFEYDRIYNLFLLAANNFEESKYRQIAESLYYDYKTDLNNILFKK